MYYQEKWINGELYYKHSPKGKWYKFTEEMYIKRLIEREHEITSLKYDIEKLTKIKNMNTEFTQEIKDQWLDALKSGKYIQGKVHLEYIENETNIKKHCCIGVLGCILGMNNKTDEPYKYLEKNIGKFIMSKLYRLNDETYNPNKPDYSTVIPLIQKLKVK